MKRAASLGIRSVLLADEGALWVAGEMRQAGILPREMQFKVSVMMASANPASIRFMKRWSLEVTFEEGRAHLGIETQRQWSDLATRRSTPLLFGLYSLVTLFGQALHPDGCVPVARVGLVSQAGCSIP